MLIQELKLVHWDEPRDEDGDTFIVTLIRFAEKRDGSFEVMFSDKRTPNDYTSLVGFKQPFIALKNIFAAVDAITTAFPGKYFYKADAKRASVYKRYTNLELRV